MDKTTAAAAPADPPVRSRQHTQQIEDQADRFEDDLAAEMIRTGAIEQW